MTQQKTQSADKVGYGPTFPLRFRGNDFECGTGYTLVASAARIILGADGASRDGKMRGEFRGNQRLGTQMGRYLDSNIRSAPDIMRVVGITNLTEQEPRLECDPYRSDVSTSDRSVVFRFYASLAEDVSGTSSEGRVIETERSNG